MLRKFLSTSSPTLYCKRVSGEGKGPNGWMQTYLAHTSWSPLLVLVNPKRCITAAPPLLYPSPLSPKPSCSREKRKTISVRLPVSQTTAAVTQSPATKDEQDELSRIVLQGASVYVGGKAGTGKSFFLRRVVDELREKGLRVAVTGSTGVAALNIGGSTFHSFFGIPVDSLNASHPRRQPFSALKSSYSLPSASSSFHFAIKLDVLRQFDVIVIDEISFLHAGYLELLERSARVAREKEKARTPFGGIQIVLSGDFLQLTSVEQNGKDQIQCSGVGKIMPLEKISFLEKRKSIVRKRMPITYYRDKPMFESYAFQNYLLHAEFVNVHRHRDIPFVKALNRLRLGEFPALIAKAAVHNPENEKAIRLFATKNSVLQYNRLKMMKLKGEEYYFPSDISLNGMSTTTSNHGERYLSDVLIIFAILKGKKSAKKKRITVSDAQELVEMIRCANGLSKQSITWCILPEAAVHFGVSRIAIRFSDFSTKKCAEHLSKVIYWVTSRIKKDKSMLFVQEQPCGVKPSSPVDSFQHSCLILKYAVRTIQQLTAMLKHSIGAKLLFSLQNDYSLCGKRLKVGCRVMLLKNMNDRYVNGSLGEVVGFMPASECKDKLPSQMRPPALTSYGSKEQMIVKNDEEDLFMEVSTSSSVLKTAKASENNISSRKNKAIEISGKKGFIPLVRMDLDRKVIAVPYLLLPLPSPVQADGFYSIGIICMPLTPAYAFTVHKVQGLTFNHPVLFDAGGLFPCDHIVYVAASRVTRLAFLRIINLSPRMISVHRPSLHFSLSLYPVRMVVETWENYTSLNEPKKAEPSNPSLFLPTWAEKKNPQKSNQ